MLLSIAAPSVGIGSTAGISAEIGAELRRQGLQGAVWSTVLADGAVALGAAGIKDARLGQPMGVEDRVQVGSVAKTLVATGILRLVTEGRLALDAPIEDLVSGIVIENPWASSDPIRVRHLLDQTAGLDDARIAHVFSVRVGADLPLAEAVAAGQPRLRLRSRPGARHSYSNIGYTLAGMVIETVTGTRYETYLDTHLLQPLGMHDSTFSFTTQTGARGDPRIAMGHFERGEAHASVPTRLRPAGQLTTTAGDMARLARFLMGDGRVEGRTFIDQRLLSAMGVPVDTEAAAAGLRVGYALGLYARDRHGSLGKCQGGSTIGFHALFCLFPEQQRAFFLSINTDSETAQYDRFHRLLIRELKVDGVLPSSTAGSTPASGTWAGFYVPSPSRMATFAWLDTVFNFAVVRAHGPNLRLWTLQSPELTLTPTGGSLYRRDDRVTASHAFSVTADDQRVMSTAAQTYQEASLGHLMLLWSSLAIGILGLTYLILVGLSRVLTRRARPSDPGFPPFVGSLALLLPVPLFYRQPFLEMGDLTVASGALAAVTGLLPFAMLAGLALRWRRRPWHTMAALEVAAMLGVLQFTVVLAYWGLLPLKLWV
ncbi:MAG TPA: serine hydrolase domain-containing protein [Steroidobacteraceae bacterium]|nr:serine hydrolase domain-containing protein [Steroidobacteraceae bacterium]